MLLFCCPLTRLLSHCTSACKATEQMLHQLVKRVTSLRFGLNVKPQNWVQACFRHWSGKQAVTWLFVCVCDLNKVILFVQSYLTEFIITTRVHVEGWGSESVTLRYKHVHITTLSVNAENIDPHSTIHALPLLCIFVLGSGFSCTFWNVSGLETLWVCIDSLPHTSVTTTTRDAVTPVFFI